ncbi:MAG: mechanosensitive ion channel [Bacteroidetes Order II. Incertae sedis bacterium]|nr:mechanosensitive ion channel [Bacteroidetes Order II. bacterium]
MSFVWILPLLITCSLFGTQPAVAQSQTAVETEILDDSVSADDREKLLARLSDKEVRDIVWNLIQEKSKHPQSDNPLAAELNQLTSNLRSNFKKRLQDIPTLLTLPSILSKAITPPERKKGFFAIIFLMIALVILFGWTGQYLCKRMTRVVYASLTRSRIENFPQKLARRILIFLYDLVHPVIFAVMAYLAFMAVYQGYEPNRILMLSVITGIFSAWALIKTIGCVFSPNRPDARLTSLDDEDSKLVSQNLNIVVIYAMTIYFFSGYLSGIAPIIDTSSTVPIVNSLGGLSIMLLVVIVIWRVRLPVGKLILSGKPPGLARKLLSTIWPAIGTAVIVALTTAGLVGALALNMDSAFNAVLKTLLLLLIGLPLSLGLIGPLIRQWGRNPDTDDTAPVSRTNARDGIVQIARLILLVTSAMLLGRIWGIDVVEMTRSSLGERVSGAVTQIVITIIVANLVWSLVKRWIESQDNVNSGDDPDSNAGGDPGGQGLTRIETVLPLLRGFLLITIITVATMISLSSLGVDIGPLIAAASVLGLAIGFGAQTLVADIISGIFFLVDDAFRKGEYIDVSGNTGTVESISVRSMQLRHHNGPIHTIPYSQISTLTNFSRDWVIMKFELRIPFEEDVEKVRKLIKKIGKKLLDDPEHGSDFLEPLKSQGVNRMDDSAFVVRCKFSTKPGKQWAIRRIAYAEIQAAFSEAGIKFAPKRVVVEAVTPEIAAAGAAALTSNPESDSGKS